MRENFVVLSDVHAPFHDPGCIVLALEYIRQVRPKHIILNGDILDNYSVSDFERMQSGPTNLVVKRKDWGRLGMGEWDIAEAEFFKPLIEASGGANIVWVEGNHERRFTGRLFHKMVRAHLEAVHGNLISLEEFFRLDQRNIKYIKSKGGNGIYRGLSPHLTIMHGKRCGPNAARLQLSDWGDSLIMGHVHRANTWSEPRGCGGEMVAMSSGSLSAVEDYIDITKHTRGFIAGYVDEQGHFAAEHQKILTKNTERYELVSPDIGSIIATRKRVKGCDSWFIGNQGSVSSKRKFRRKR